MKFIQVESTTEKGLKKITPAVFKRQRLIKRDSFVCEPGGARTHDQLVKSQLLYQLSYRF